jgi:hypothetical protein
MGRFLYIYIEKERLINNGDWASPVEMVGWNNDNDGYGNRKGKHRADE